jgi:hypothetical protein
MQRAWGKSAVGSQGGGLFTPVGLSRGRANARWDKARFAQSFLALDGLLPVLWPLNGVIVGINQAKLDRPQLVPLSPEWKAVHASRHDD